MTGAPKLPADISSDGREVWDWAAEFSAHVHRQDEIRRLSADIIRIGRRCGDCRKWMKSRECPRERNVNGRNQGPSGEAPTCNQFVECHFATARRAELSEKLAALKSEEGRS